MVIRSGQSPPGSGGSGCAAGLYRRPPLLDSFQVLFFVPPPVVSPDQFIEGLHFPVEVPHPRDQTLLFLFQVRSHHEITRLQLEPFRHIPGVEVRDPVRYVRHDPAAEDPHEERANLDTVSDPSLIGGRGFHDLKLPPDLFCVAEPSAEAEAHVHTVTQVPDLLIHVKRLAEQVYFDLELPLEFEPVPDGRVELLEVPVIPDHADLVDEQHAAGREHGVADVFVRHLIGSRYRAGAVHIPLFLLVLQGKLDQQCCLAGALLAEYHDQLIRIAVFDRHKHKKRDDQNDHDQNIM